LVSTLSNGAVDMPATGFAMGDAVIAHLIEACPAARALRDAAVRPNACDVCLVLAAPEMRMQMLALASTLRDAGLRVDLPLAPAKMGNQLKRAEKIGARYAVVVGAEYPQVELKTLATRESVKTDLEALLTELCPDED
jgi:histidyl-tRNA synthetase